MQRTTPSRHYGPHARFPGRPGASIWKLRHRQSLASTVPNATGAYRKLPGRVSHPLATHDFVAHNEATTIDLKKRGDLNLVYRAVLNGWKVPQHVREQICEQLEPAMDHYQNAGDPRATRRMIKMANMVLLMDVSNRVDAGERKSLHPVGRKRYPEKRKPRRLSTRDSVPPFHRALLKLAAVMNRPASSSPPAI